MYNLTNITAGNQTNLLTFAQGVNNELMGGLMGVFLLISVGVVIYSSMALMTQEHNKSAMTTLLILFSLSLALYPVGLIPQFVIWLILIMWAVMLGFSLWGND